MSLSISLGALLAGEFGRQAAHFAPPSATAFRRELPPPAAGAVCAAADRLVVRARRAAAPASLLVMAFFDLPELAGLFGPDAVVTASHEAARHLRRACGRTSVVGRIAADTFIALKPGVSAELLHECVCARLGRSCAIEFDGGGEDLLLVPQVMLREIQAGESVAQACTSIRQQLAARREREDSRSEWLRAERESHIPRTARC